MKEGKLSFLFSFFLFVRMSRSSCVSRSVKPKPSASTPLHVATEAQEVEQLLASGENIEALDEERKTPLHTASAKGILPVVDCLVRHGANLNTTDFADYTPLVSACIGEHTHIVSRLLQEKELDIDFITPYSRTALMYASEKGCTDIVDLLIERGASVNLNGAGGLGPLHRACRYGKLDVADRLLKKGADPNALDDEGFPLIWACYSGSLGIFDILVVYGADYNKRSPSGLTCLMVASTHGKEDVVGRLLSLNVDVNAQDDQGETALHKATTYGHVEIVKLLLSAKADVSLVNHEGKKAIDFAKDEIMKGLFPGLFFFFLSLFNKILTTHQMQHDHLISLELEDTGHS